MALDKQNLIALALAANKASANPQLTFSYGEEKFAASDINGLLRKEINELCSTYALWRQNKNVVFELMENVIDDVLPERVLEQYGQFAEVKTVPQGTKNVFVQRITTASKRRAKKFITRVGLAGRYEVFKLDGKHYDVPTNAYGGAAQIAFEEFLDGRIDMADVTEIVMEGLDEAIYIEIENALKGAISDLGEANRYFGSDFNEVEMDKLLQVADSYGRATIYCTFEFAATMVPSDGWVSDEMRNQKWNNGYLGNYKGHNVVVFKQSFEDETNAVKVIDPSYCWIIPTGAEKPVKIVLEGQTIVRDFDNYDYSKEIQVYKKLGVGAIITNDICVYVNSSLTR